MPLKIDIEKHFLFVLLPLRLGKENFWALIKKKKRIRSFSFPFSVESIDSFHIFLGLVFSIMNRLLESISKTFLWTNLRSVSTFPSGNENTYFLPPFSLSPNYRVLRNETHLSLKKKQEKNFTDIWSLLINTYLSNNWRRNTIK